MNMKWETFPGKQYEKDARREPRVTLGAKGTFYLNGVAFEARGTFEESYLVEPGEIPSKKAANLS